LPLPVVQSLDTPHSNIYDEAGQPQEVKGMPRILASLYQKTWWSLLIRGIAAFVLGILALTWPGHVLAVIVTLLGILVLVIGIVAVIGAMTHRDESKRWLVTLIPGLIGIVIGIITIAWPAVTTVIVVYLIAIWALIHGFGEIYNALKLRKDVEGEWMPLIIGIVSVILGLLLLIRPLTAGTVVTWLVGLIVLVLGVFWLIMAFRARRMKDSSEEAAD
jgi:uncharacterized membrane protein HdeD (DUF308 family)